MRRAVILILLAVMLVGSARGIDVTQQQSAMLETDKLENALPEDAQEYMKGISPESAEDLFGNATDILKKAAADSGSAIKQALRTAAILLTASILCALISSFLEGKAQWAVSVSGILAIAVCCIGNLKTMIGLGKETIKSLDVFTKLLIPVMAAATSATGAVVSASAIQAGAVLFMQVLISFFHGILVPAVYGYTALSVANAALEQGNLSGIKKFFENFIKKSLRILLFIFSGYLSLSGILSGSADALTVKAAKMTVSTLVPVVGGMLSDASETVLVSMKLLRNSVGIFGMLAVLSIMVVPFLRLGIQYLVLQLTGALCSLVGRKEHSALIGSMSSAMGYLLAMVGCCGLMTFLACVCFLKVNVL